MTCEEIDAMPAGGEIDVAVAKMITGMKKKMLWIPPFSTDIGFAWEIVRKLVDRFGFDCADYGVVLQCDGEIWECFVAYNCGVGDDPGVSWRCCGEGDSAPLAICRAMLKSERSIRD